MLKKRDKMKQARNDHSHKELKTVKSSVVNLNLNNIVSPINKLQKPKGEQKSEFASLLNSTRGNLVLSARPSQYGNISENFRYNNVKMP